MTNITNKDLESIIEEYKNLLYSLKVYLEQFNKQDILITIKRIMLDIKSGFFSINQKMEITDNYDYLPLPSLLSNGVHVTYGIACCRHINTFIYDLLKLMEYNPKLLYIFIDKDNNWRKTTPSKGNGNHVVVLITFEGEEYICDGTIDSILKVESNGDLSLQDINIGV